MMAFRFLQGVGTGGEVPVGSAYINEFIGAEKRGRFFLLYEVIFPIGLMFAGNGGLLPGPNLRLAGDVHCRLDSVGADHSAALVHAGVAALARIQAPHRRSRSCRETHRPLGSKATDGSDWRELFKGIYLKRTFTIWGLWLCVYMINNGLVTWLPTLYKQVFQLPLQTSLAYGWTTSGVQHLRWSDLMPRAVLPAEAAACICGGAARSNRPGRPSSRPPSPTLHKRVRPSRAIVPRAHSGRLCWRP